MNRPAGGGGSWAAGLFRASRVCVLTLAVVVSFESITAMRETLLLLGGVLLAVALVGGKVRPRATVLIWPLLLYLAMALISLITSVSPLYSLSEIRGVLLKGIFAYFIMVNLIDHERHIRQVWTALLIGAALVSISGLVFLAIKDSNLPGDIVRASSLTEGYQYFATYLVLVWPLLLLGPMMFEDRRFRMLNAALIPLAMAAAYITQTRGAWLALCVQSGLLLVMLSKRRLVAALAGIALCVGLVALVLSTPGFSHGEKWDQLLSNPAGVQGSAGDLVEVWRHSWQEIKEHPFSGIGYGRDTFMIAYPEFRSSHHALLWHTHNVFVESALHLGVQGLAALLLVLGVLAYKLWPRSVPSAGRPGDLAAAAGLATLVGFCIRNMTDSLFVDSPALLFWMIMGLAMSRAYLPVGNESG